MDGAPNMTSESPTAATTVSLWQLNCVGLKTIVQANWRPMRDGSVAWIDGIAYRPFTT
jgi:hypothetical protein